MTDDYTTPTIRPIDPQDVGAGLVLVGLLTAAVLGIAYWALPLALFAIVAAGWAIAALGILVLAVTETDD